MEDDMEDIIFEPNLEKKESLNSSSKGHKQIMSKAKKNTKNLKKDKKEK